MAGVGTGSDLPPESVWGMVRRGFRGPRLRRRFSFPSWPASGSCRWGWAEPVGREPARVFGENILRLRCDGPVGGCPCRGP